MADATRYTSRLTAVIALSMLLLVPAAQLLAGDDTDSVIVHKQCIPDDAGGVFEITLLDDGGDPAIADQNPISIGCGESATFTGVEEGTYSAVEAILQGDFEETSNDCQGLDLDVAFPPPECTIVNEAPAPGSITIVKETTGGDGTFSFTTENLDPAGFDIETDGGTGQHVFDNLQPGQTYEVTEIVPDGWEFDGIECEAGDNTVVVIAGTSVAIDLGTDGSDVQNGDHVICTFTNTLLTGSITIVKTSGSEEGETFDFTGDLGDFQLTVPDGGGSDSVTFDDLPLGDYTVTEVVPENWVLAGLNCEGAPDEVIIDLPSVTIVLSEPTDVTCTFTNRFTPPPEPGSITIVKETEGGDGIFGFVSDQLGAFTITTTGGSGDMIFGDLPPGTYEIMENVPAGWNFTGIFCEQGDQTVIVIDPQNASAAIDLPQGDDVTCTFTNTAVAEPTTTITIIKTATGGDGETFGFTGDLGDFDITIAGVSGSQSFPGMPAGTYNVTEIVPAGWTLAALSCDNADSSTDLASGTATVVVTANDIQVSCFFTNRSGDPVVEPVVVPTLSRLALVVLGLLLALIAWWALRRAHA